MRLRHPVLALTLVALLTAACGGGASDAPSDGGTTGASDGATDGATGASEIAAQVASFDLAVGEDQRLLLGLFTAERQVVGGGEVEVRVGYLGEERPEADAQVEMSDVVTASFLPVPGAEPEVGDTPTLIEGSGVGVYEAAVDLDRAGFWGAQVAVELAGETVTATAAFPVVEEHRVPTVGDPAPRTENATIDDPKGLDPIAIDSRAQGEDAEIPAPELHDTTIASALDAGRPVVVVISTPVYCASQFCGPITDHVAGLAGEYGDRAEFVHLEVWEDFNAEELNDAAAEWVFDEEFGGNEPWVFLVGADGTIQARWDNVLDGAELESMLEGLPA